MNNLIILAVNDYIKCDWHEVNINYIRSGSDLYSYLKKYYNTRCIDIEIDIEGIRYDLKKINSLYKHCSKNPNRICLYLYF